MHHEKLLLPSAAAAVVHDGRVLLVMHRTLGTWHLPGGFQDLGESIRQTAERELREETGLELRSGPLVSVLTSPEWDVHYPNGDAVQSFELSFLMSGYVPGMQCISDEREIVACDWFSLDRLPEELAPCCRRKCQDLKAFDGTPFIR